MQVVLVKGLDIQDVVTLKKYDKKVKKFLTNKNGNDILIKLSAGNADNTAKRHIIQAIPM